MRPRPALLALAAALALLSPACKKPANRPPAVPQMPTGITTGERDSTYEFKSAAVDPDGDLVALRFAWGNGDTTGWSAWVTSGETTNTFHRWASAGTYVITVQAKDDSGLLSEWSAGQTTAISNRAPSTPATPSGPPGCSVGEPCRFSSTAVDPNHDGIALRFAWGDGDTSDWSTLVGSGETAAASHTWARADTYLVAAQAMDKPGAVSAWSPSHSIEVTNQAPRRPTAATGPSAAVTDHVCRFDSRATDENGDSVALRFAWGDDTTEWSEWVASGDTVTAEHSWAIAGDYGVTVQARDGAGAVSAWSSPKAVTIALRGPGVVLWNYWTAGSVTSAAIGADGTIFFGSSDSAVYALNPDGTRRWKYHTGHCVGSSPSIGSDGTIYIGSDDWYVYALNQDGTLKWRYWTQNRVLSSPAIGSDGTIYVGSNDYHLYALNPDGSLKWRYLTVNNVVASPCVDALGQVYFGSDDNVLYALHPDGSLKWSYQTRGDIRTAPAIGSDGTVYFGSDDHYIYALSPDGSLKWRYHTGNDVGSSPAIGLDGTIYAGSEDNYVYALTPDGARRWHCSTGGNVGSSPAIGSDGTIYVGSLDACLYAINPDGTTKWSLRMADEVSACPAIGPNSTIYVGSGYYMNAVQATGHLAGTPWPKFHHDNQNSGCVGGP
jgi:outer membrane protein assembly factor BamB